MTALVGYLLLFTGVGVAFILVNLLVGKLLRPAKMDAEKATIYECGEPTIGSAWVQFDLRFYVVALLFVIFDVEMAFFFPWAVVFGKANQLADPRLAVPDRIALSKELGSHQLAPEIRESYIKKLEEEPKPSPNVEGQSFNLAVESNISTASSLAWLAFVDILFFFGVLLVGFAYLWRRGDLDWVRSLSAQKADRVGLTVVGRD
ncbi:MAG: NADH-quinone oxidoreductase subunit A [Gemmataceae bacterium]